MPENGGRMVAKFIRAYDKRTGKKLEHRVPEALLRIFPTLAPTPRQRFERTFVDYPQADVLAETDKEN